MQLVRGESDIIIEKKNVFMSAKVAQCKMDGQAGILELRNGAELCILYMP